MKLIIILMLISGNTQGGAHSSIEQVTFAKKKDCEIAKKQIQEKNAMNIDNTVSSGIYVIKAYCI